MEINIKMVSDSIFTTYVWPIITTVLGVIIGGFITLKVNAIHEKKKIIMDKKLKLWDFLSECFVDIEDKVIVIKKCIPTRYNIGDREEIVEKIIELLPDLKDYIIKMDRKLNDYCIILEKIGYVLELKNKYYDLKICANTSDFDYNKFSNALNEFDLSLLKLRVNIRNELIKDLSERKTNRKRKIYYYVSKFHRVIKQIFDK